MSDIIKSTESEFTKPLTLDAAGGARSLAVSPRPDGAWITWLEGAPSPRARAGALRCGPRAAE